MFRVASIAIAALVAAVTPASTVPSRALDIEQRIAAQRAIDGVYRLHQIDRPERRAEAIPRAILEKKVRTYLREAVALERIFGARISPEALHREVERVARHTRFPERVEEIYDALGRDPFLVEECFARPILVGRLLRNRYARDPVIHAAARREADEIRQRLAEGDLDPGASHPRRREVEWRRDAAGSDTFEKDRPLVPRHVGEVSLVEQTHERYVVRVLLEGSVRGVRFAEYGIPIVPWESFWPTVAESFDSEVAATISTGGWALPSPGKGARSQGNEEGMLSACNVSGGGWAELPEMPKARPGHTAVWTGTEMIVWGGGEVHCDATDIPPTRTGGRYDPLTDTWSPTSILGAPSERKDHTAVWTGSEMIVWGGEPGGARYDPETDSWSPVSSANAPSSRFRHTAVWTGTEMIVWGGTHAYCGPVLDSGGRYDPATDTWRTTSLIGAPPPREQHTAVWTGSEMIVWGGGTYDDCSCYFTSILASGARYDPVADQWTPLPPAGAPIPRAKHTAVWTGSRMIVWGGASDKCLELDSGSAYAPAENLWVPISSVGAPAERSSHTAVWTGDRMVVWGGVSCLNPLNTGGSYDLLLDAWSATAASGAPGLRSLHTAVWTGKSMIVWGGDAGFSYDISPVADGRSYDPTSNAWTPISDGPGPSARTSHTAVWSGNEMIVWGGQPDPYTGTSLATGGRYDAIVDDWIPTSVPGAPSGRTGHAAIWAGNRMLVWGGSQASAGNTGGRYDPLSDSWKSMSSGGAPTVTTAPAVWTGTEMILWGSYSGSVSGGRYDPATDLWAPISAVGAPSPRFEHVAVWTGREMIVYGGHPQGADGLQTGGRYDPLADTWTPTTPVNAAYNPFSRAAVWSGQEMIVFPSFGGARYSPETDSWGAITTDGSPSLSGAGPAVWDGASMIVRSGHYYPGMNQWRAVPSDGGLGIGTGTAVWTGKEMITWDHGVGGRYTPGLLLDLDGDGRVSCVADCNDAVSELWSPPGEARSLRFDADRRTLRWLPPADQGGAASPRHDLLRSPSPVDFFTGTTCIGTDGLDTHAIDPSIPLQSSPFYYLVRAQNTCPSGEGPLAVGPNDGVRYGRQCP